jgi:hypothetical protein
MHPFFRASPRISSFLELLSDPSKKGRVDMSGQALGEQEWLPLSPKVVELPDEPYDEKPFDREDASSEGVSTVPPVPLVEPWEDPTKR